MNKILGIDLGTTYSSIAHVDEYGKAVIIPNAENQRVTPSVVFFDGEHIVVGDVAKESAKLYPNEVVSFIKRSMGEPDFLFDYGGKTYRAEEISSFILRKVVQDAERSLRTSIDELVITCPAYFGINEREATRRAGEIAGFKIHQIINEPTAAAIAYGAVESSEERCVLVYDLGGGTFDVTMIKIQPDAIDVICTGGDHNLGGKDWDDRIVAHLVKEFQTATQTDEDILEDPDTWQDLQLSAEKSKKILTQREKTPISITHGGDRVKVELMRSKFEEITRDLLERTISLTKEMLEEAKGKGHNQYDEIILVGGATRMPQVGSRIQEEFSVEPKVFEPDEAVAKGAAIFGWKIALNDNLVQRVAQKTNTNLKSIDDVIDLTPEMVINEAAQQVADDTGYTLTAVKRSTIRIKNVTSKSFGVVARDPKDRDRVFNLILRNITVPVDARRTFYTTAQNQESVLIRIMESETSEKIVDPDNAIEIGTAVLTLPPNLPVEVPIEILFKLNEEGRLLITAVEASGSRKVDATVNTTSVIQGEELAEAKARSQSLKVI
ncbi:MAG: Hsp70 family protein [Desulfobacterales bacterium]|nr:Hsp70 family protein [Desulfobacterales bacterium]